MGTVICFLASILPHQPVPSTHFKANDSPKSIIRDFRGRFRTLPFPHRGPSPGLFVACGESREFGRRYNRSCQVTLPQLNRGNRHLLSGVDTNVPNQPVSSTGRMTLPNRLSPFLADFLARIDHSTQYLMLAIQAVTAFN